MAFPRALRRLRKRGAATGQIEAGYSLMGYRSAGQVPASALFGANAPSVSKPAGYTAWMYQGGGDELL